MFPKFLGIGAQKAGTTWLHTMLSTHEEIWLPRLKELHYFDRKFPIGQGGCVPAARPGRGVVVRHIATRLRRIDVAKLRERLSVRGWADVSWELRYLFGAWNDEWYASLFDNARGRLAGEVTPAYSCLSEPAISHVHALMPNTKLILLLRDPIDRAWSHARMDLANTVAQGADAVSETAYLTHFNGPASRLRGNYLETIRRWRTHFRENQLFLGFYDEILASPEDLLLRIFQFLGVSATDESIPSGVRTRFNAGQRATIPPRLHQHLATLYVDDLRELAIKYGKYPKRWLKLCESALTGTLGS